MVELKVKNIISVHLKQADFQFFTNTFFAIIVIYIFKWLIYRCFIQ